MGHLKIVFWTSGSLGNTLETALKVGPFFSLVKNRHYLLDELRQAQGLRWFPFLFLAPPTTAPPPKTMSPGKWNSHFSPDTGEIYDAIDFFRHVAGFSVERVSHSREIVPLHQGIKPWTNPAKNRARPPNEYPAVCIRPSFPHFQAESL